MRYVTSFGPEGYKQYGREFLVSYTKHIHTPLTVYVEEPCDFKHPSITYKNLYKTEGCQDFLNQLSFDVYHGRMMGGKQRDYRYDIFKFCRKSFAQIDAASQNGDWLIWIDSDVVLSGALPAPSGDSFMYYLGRPEWHSCASYVAWNTKHPISGEFFKNYWMLYMTGTVFRLSEWHDSFILDELRKQLNVPAVNLAEPYAEQLTGPANVFDVVFPMAHHKKGNLKNAPADH